MRGGALVPKPRTSTRCGLWSALCALRWLRQAEQLRPGDQRIILETRHFNEETGDTTSGRSKEEAEDYRYFPEPDLVPVAPSESWIEQLRGTLPEVPSVRRARLQNDWGISGFDMQSLVNAGALELIIVASIDAGVQPSAARKWWTGELTRVANERDCELEELTVTPADIAQIRTGFDFWKACNRR